MADASGSTTRPKLGAAPRPSRLESLYVDPISSWTPATIRAALDSHEQGNFYTSACLADAVLRDSRIMRGVRRRTTKLASRSALPFKVEAGGGDGRRREAIRRRTEELWWDAHSESTIGALLRDAILLGLALGRLEWERTATEWRPCLHHIPAHGLEWQPWDRRWIYNTEDGQRIEVTPGDGTWFLHLPHGPRSWMLGSVRCVGLKWLMRENGWVHWARSDERHSSPTLAIKEPHFATDDVEGVEGLTKAQQFYASNFRIGPNVALRLPQGPPNDGAVTGWSAEWLELKGEPGAGSKSFVDALASEFDVALLGADTDGGAKGGDGELASERVNVEDLASDAETLSTSLREQVWKPFVAFNYSPDDTDSAAWGRWTTRPPPDLQARADTLDKAGDALTKLLPLGVRGEPIAAEFALEVAKGGELKAPPAPAPAATKAAKGDDDATSEEAKEPAE